MRLMEENPADPAVVGNVGCSLTFINLAENVRMKEETNHKAVLE